MHRYAIVGPEMVPLDARKDSGDCADDALGRRVILPRARDPVSRLFDVDLPAWVVVPE